MRFVFTTNAPAGKERDFPLLSRFRKLEAWQHLTAEPASAHSDEIMAGVRRVLASTRRPFELGMYTDVVEVGKRTYEYLNQLSRTNTDLKTVFLPIVKFDRYEGLLNAIQTALSSPMDMNSQRGDAR
ncbi:hypothetical protein Rcae01_04679 [Novipirellula caenicola]|uniref:Uncharacterized protein n=1 Tax=Novipirellula caenicola TaxID=1536901 RepID=A0ABP9VWV4_9BACT